MNVLILGGTRYFGRRLVDLLLARGHAVTVASRRATATTFVGAPIRIDVARDNEGSMRERLGGKRFDVVVDQICMRPEEATLAIATLRGAIGRYIMTSTMSVYAPGARRLTEDAFVASNAPVNVSAELDYAEGKRRAEAVFAQSAPFPTARVRVPMVLGEDDYTGRLARHVSAATNARRIAFHSVCAPVSMISSASMAAFLSWVVENEVEGAINAGSNEPISGLDVLRAAERVLGGGAQVVRTDDEDDPDFSPYSSPVDIVVDTERARALGYAFDSVQSWLAEAIRLTAVRLAQTTEAASSST